MKYIKKSKIPSGSQLNLFKPDNIYIVQTSTLDASLPINDWQLHTNDNKSIVYVPDCLPIKEYLYKIPNCHRGFKKNSFITTIANPYLNMEIKDCTANANVSALCMNDDLLLHSTAPYALIQSIDEKSGKLVGSIYAITIDDLEPSPLDPFADPKDYYIVYETCDIMEINHNRLYTPQILPADRGKYLYYPIGLSIFHSNTNKAENTVLLDNPSKVRARLIQTKTFDFYVDNFTFLLRTSYGPHYRASIHEQKRNKFYSTVNYNQILDKTNVEENQQKIQDFLYRSNNSQYGGDLIFDDETRITCYDGISSEIRQQANYYDYARNHTYYINSTLLGIDYQDVESIDDVYIEFTPVGTIGVENNNLIIKSDRNCFNLFLKTLDGYAPIYGYNIKENSKIESNLSWDLNTHANRYIVKIGEDLFFPIVNGYYYQYVAIDSLNFLEKDSLKIFTTSQKLYSRNFTSNKSKRVKTIKINSELYTMDCVVKLTTKTGLQKTTRINYYDEFKQ